MLIFRNRMTCCLLALNVVEGLKVYTTVFASNVNTIRFCASLQDMCQILRTEFAFFLLHRDSIPLLHYLSVWCEALTKLVDFPKPLYPMYPVTIYTTITSQAHMTICIPSVVLHVYTNAPCYHRGWWLFLFIRASLVGWHDNK
jgi:hypothetical protein